MFAIAPVKIARDVSIHSADYAFIAKDLDGTWSLYCPNGAQWLWSTVTKEWHHPTVALGPHGKTREEFKMTLEEATLLLQTVATLRNTQTLP